MNQLTYAPVLYSGFVPSLPPLVNEDIPRSKWLKAKEIIDGCWRT